MVLLGGRGAPAAGDRVPTVRAGSGTELVGLHFMPPAAAIDQPSSAYLVPFVLLQGAKGLEFASVQAADQRAGRNGVCGDEVCGRCWRS